MPNCLPSYTHVIWDYKISEDFVSVWLNFLRKIISKEECVCHCFVSFRDVEQKLIFPFLTASEPMGLGIDSSQIMTKAVLRQQCIGR
jgi:hypothetical protein